jgi:hypothetical protein
LFGLPLLIARQRPSDATCFLTAQDLLVSYWVLHLLMPGIDRFLRTYSEPIPQRREEFLPVLFCPYEHRLGSFLRSHRSASAQPRRLDFWRLGSTCSISYELILTCGFLPAGANRTIYPYASGVAPRS